MKKILLTTVCLLFGFLPLSSQPRRPVNFRIGVYGGANLAEDRPLAGGFFSVTACNVMVDVDLGWSYLGSPRQDFMYINPSAGFYLGDKVRFYGLIGITNWAGIKTRTGKFKSDYIWWKAKAGVDYYLNRHLFLTAGWSYVIDSGRSDVHPFEQNAITAGIGFYF